MRREENLYEQETLNDEFSFEEIITQNEGKILNLIYGMTGNYHLSQDLTQETFIKAFQARHTFKGESKISSWLYRIAVNVAIDHQRKNYVRKENLVEEPETSIYSECPDPDKICQERAVRDILFATIARLPEQQKEVYLLREINGCSTREVAEIINCSVELVKWRLHKAKSTLRKMLKEVEYKNTGKYNLRSTGLE